MLAAFSRPALWQSCSFFVRDFQARQGSGHHAKSDGNARLILPGITKPMQTPVGARSNQFPEPILLIRFNLYRSSRTRFGDEAAAFFKLAFVALDAGRTDTKALGHRVNRCPVFKKGRDDPLSKIHRVGLHELQYSSGQQ